MAVDKIWVIAERVGGKALPVALELLTKARELAGTVEAFTLGRRDTVGRRSSAPTGRPRSTRRRRPRLVACRASGRGGRHRRSGRGRQRARRHPRADQTYDGRDIAGRLSARIDRPVLTNVVGLEADDGGLVTEHGIFGGSRGPEGPLHRRGPGIFVIRAKSFAAEEGGGGRPRSRHRRGARHRRQRRGHASRNAMSRSATGPSSTRPPSSSPAAGAWARPATTR